jgi:hypothetical protein
MDQASNSENPLPSATPGVVPQETPRGVRYVRPLAVRRKGLGTFVQINLFGVVILAAALACAVYLLAVTWESLPAWQAGLALLYPLQLAIDLAALARLTGWLILWALSDLEIEFSEGDLRAGKRWGPFWLAPQSVPAGNLRQLLIVQRPPVEPVGTSWELLVEQENGPPLVVASAYGEPELIRGIARDLHLRIGASPARPLHWPALVEVEQRRAAETPSPWLRPLMPGGAHGWFVVHVAGCVGMLFLFLAVRGHSPRAPIHMGFLAPAFLLQLLIVLANITLLKATGKKAQS